MNIQRGIQEEHKLQKDKRTICRPEENVKEGRVLLGKMDEGEEGGLFLAVPGLVRSCLRVTFNETAGFRKIKSNEI